MLIVPENIKAAARDALLWSHTMVWRFAEVFVTRQKSPVLLDFHNTLSPGEMMMLFDGLKGMNCSAGVPPSPSTLAQLMVEVGEATAQ
jgi:hypothetical protein